MTNRNPISGDIMPDIERCGLSSVALLVDGGGNLSSPGKTRTCDPLINSQVVPTDIGSSFRLQHNNQKLYIKPINQMV